MKKLLSGVQSLADLESNFGLGAPLISEDELLFTLTCHNLRQTEWLLRLVLGDSLQGKKQGSVI